MSDQHLYPHFAVGSVILTAAFYYANAQHGHMIRKGDGAPYINHPVRVAAEIRAAGGDEAMIAAGFLHDTVEDTDSTIAGIRNLFGDDIAALVDAMTEDKSTADYETRKADALVKLQAGGPRAAAVFAADKLVNFEDMAIAYRVEGERLADRFNADLDSKVAHTEEHIELLDRIIPGNSTVEKLRELLAEFKVARSSELAARPA